MTLKYKRMVSIVAKYDGLMTDEEIHTEFGIPKYKIRNIRKAIEKQRHTPKHKCWECAKATNMYRCHYVATCLGDSTPVMYEGTVTSENGCIIECPEFEAG